MGNRIEIEKTAARDAAGGTSVKLNGNIIPNIVGLEIDKQSLGWSKLRVMFVIEVDEIVDSRK